MKVTFYINGKIKGKKYNKFSEAKFILPHDFDLTDEDISNINNIIGCSFISCNVYKNCTIYLSFFGDDIEITYIENTNEYNLVRVHNYSLKIGTDILDCLLKLKIK